MNIQQAIELDLHKATKQELQQANKILTRALNRQLLGFRYGSTKTMNTKQAGFFKDFVKAHGGEYQVHIDRKPGEVTTRNKMMSHVSDLQYWLRRKDSSVSKWKARIKTAPKFMTPDMKKDYEKLTVDEQNLFWKWFGKAKQDIINYEAGNLTRAVKAIISNPQNLRDTQSTLDMIKDYFDKLEAQDYRKYKQFKDVFTTGKQSGGIATVLNKTGRKVNKVVRKTNKKINKAVKKTNKNISKKVNQIKKDYKKYKKAVQKIKKRRQK